MHTIIDTPSTRSRRPKAPADTSLRAFCAPAYDSHEQDGVMKLVVYVPGVSADGVEIEGRGPDLLVTARKPRVVRVNFTALHLESAQRDYRLRLRLGAGFDFAAMTAEIANGVLTIALPRRAVPVRQPSARLACAA